MPYNALTLGLADNLLAGLQAETNRHDITPVINDRKSYNLVTARKYLNSAVYLCLMCHRHNSYLYRRE